MTKLINISGSLQTVKLFFERDLWTVQLSQLPRWKKKSYQFIRLMVITIRGFIADKCVDKASALTYFSMLSIVPVIATLFAIAKGFGLQQTMQVELERYFRGQEQILKEVLPLANNMLSGSGGGVITGISLLFLLYTVIRLLMNIEQAFNDIWHIKHNRPWERKVSDYVAIILLGPILIIIASSSTVFFTAQMQQLISSWTLWSPFQSGILHIFKILPFSIIWLLLFALYLIFPNTKVKVLPALFAGILAGSLYQLNQQAFIKLQFVVFSRYDAIYGSLAILPLFLIWLQVSWLIILFGAELAHATQRINHWVINHHKFELGMGSKKKLMLLLLFHIIKQFENKKGGISLSQLSNLAKIPENYTHLICKDLHRANLVSKIDKETPLFQPAFDIYQMDIYSVLKKYEESNDADFFIDLALHPIQVIDNALLKIEQTWKQTSHNVLVKNLPIA